MAGKRVPWSLSRAWTMPSIQCVGKACFSAEPAVLQACWRWRPAFPAHTPGLCSPQACWRPHADQLVLTPPPRERGREGTLSGTAPSEASTAPGGLCLTPWSVVRKGAGLRTGHQWSTGGNRILPPTMSAETRLSLVPLMSRSGEAPKGPSAWRRADNSGFTPCTLASDTLEF